MGYLQFADTSGAVFIAVARLLFCGCHADEEVGILPADVLLTDVDDAPAGLGVGHADMGEVFADAEAEGEPAVGVISGSLESVPPDGVKPSVCFFSEASHGRGCD